MKINRALPSFPAYLFAAALFCIAPQTAPAAIGIGISITIAPPALPVYVQPPCPTPGYLWNPGYWAYGDAGYYWVPGVWVQPPRVGLLWTPGYWGFAGGVYGWHAGFWGPHVGFYGGVNYGFGYGGVGFVGGMWSGGVFRYNTAVTAVNTTVIRNTYVNRTVINNTYVNNHVSFNGPGGIQARPSPQEQMAMNERHFQPTPQQISHQQLASRDRSQLASINHGRPANVAMDSVNGRRFGQQGRIPNGNESGRLENRQANVNHEIHNDRQTNGGRLAPPERQQVNHQQTREASARSRPQERTAREEPRHEK